MTMTAPTIDDIRTAATRIDGAVVSVSGRPSERRSQVATDLLERDLELLRQARQ